MAVTCAVGCSNPTKRLYEESTYGKPLEVPPDLTVPSFSEGLELGAAEHPATVPAEVEKAPLVVLPDQANMYVARDGAQRWLVLNGEAAQVWPWVREFFVKNGYPLSLEDPATGFMETEWAQQSDASRTDAAARSKTGEKIYTVPTRDKFRARFEHGDKPGTTEIYVTHQGAELTEQAGMLAWHLRPTDPELEAQMLKRLMIYLGAEQEKAGGVLAAPKEIVRRASLGTDSQGVAIVHIDENFAQVWRRVELALDRLEYKIEDRDRSKGVFYVVAQDSLQDLGDGKKKGWFARLFSSEPEAQRQYRVALRDEGEATNIYVRDKDGEAIDNKLAEPVLKQLQEKLQ